MKKWVFILLASLAVLPARAQYLSEVALFHRCYTQISSQRASSADPLLAQVKAGTKKATDACLEVLKRAQFNGTSNQSIADTNDVVAKSVLATFHRLHSSWFFSKDFPVISWPGHNSDTKDLYDTSTPALYFTRALFRPNTPVSTAVTEKEYLKPVRTDMNPAAGAATGHPFADFVFTNAFPFAPMGELLGVQPAGSVTMTVPTDSIRYHTGSFNLFNTLGGGLLGTQAYFLLNINAISSYSQYKTDGAVQVQRRWGKAVFHDLLCRDLPLVREADVKDLVRTNSTVPFRSSSACTKCHATQDRVAGVIRGLHVFYVGKGDPSSVGTKDRGGNFIGFHPVQSPAETEWPAASDSNYYQRPTNGVFFYRSYNGTLVDQSITSVSDLGDKIAATEDFYICAAKRYYAYFTGIDVDMGDLGDPAHFPAPNSEDLKHRDIVIKLGKSLKQSQSLQQLVSEILKLDHYRKVDFGIKTGVVNGP